MTEVWKDIPGFEGYYQVSDQGRVKSLARMLPIMGGNYRMKREAILSSAVDETGRHRVTLHKDCSQTTRRVPVLMMAAFVGPRPDGCVIAHLDGNASNNILSNLIYCSQKENARHKKLHGTQPRGETHYKTKFTEEDVRAIRKRYVPRCPRNGCRVIARDLGVHPVTISSIILRKTWAHVD
jgi:hypothetical protein